MVNSEEDFQNTDDQFVVNYEHFLMNSRYSVFGTYSIFGGLRGLNLEKEVSLHQMDFRLLELDFQVQLYIELTLAWLII
jgi:hypothetical protein